MGISRQHFRSQVAAYRHDFGIPKICRLEEARDRFVSQIVPPKIGEIRIANGIPERVGNASAGFDR